MQILMRTAKYAGLSALTLASATTAYGSFLPVSTGSDNGPPGSLTYKYVLVFATNLGDPRERLDPGDFVTLYDVQGLVSAGAPNGFTVTIQNIGVNGFGTLPSDAPSLPNVTFTYTGPTATVDNQFPGFTLVSSIFSSRIGQYTSQNTANGTDTSGQPIGGIGPVLLPQVPEPSSMLASGALGMLAILRRRK